jgi:hypothetical protein
MVLIENGCGILVVSQRHDRAFRDELLRYYESGEKTGLMCFLYSNALDGADFSNQRKAMEAEPVAKATEKRSSLDSRGAKASNDSAGQRPARRKSDKDKGH